jgi:transposase InsO family protein
MIGLEDRQALARDVHAAHAAGARLKPACEVAGIDLRTLQRWQAGTGLMQGDGRPRAVRPIPGHALSAAERARVLAVANEPRFAAVPPARIVPMLADEGVYLASESTFGRILRAHGQTAHRGRAKAPKASRPPTTHIATAPRQVWCWDMTYLPAQVTGRWFHLYLILDLYSRKIVGWEVHDSDHADHAVHLVRRTALAEGIATLDAKPVLHGDNGSTLKATTVLAMLDWLGVQPSYSRPRVSDDNAYAESLFRTAKYRPEFPAKGSPISTARVHGRSPSCIGTTSIIATAASAMSVQRSVMLEKIGTFWRPDMRFTPRPAITIPRAGPARPATGLRLAQ